MKPTQEQINAFVNVTLARWANEARAALANSATRKKLVFDNRLIDSLEAEILKADGNFAGAATIFFETYGRYLELKRSYSVPLPRKVIEEVLIPWVTKQGLSKFSYVPGYKKGVIPSESIAIRRIAWGIGHGVKKNGNLGKTTKWYTKTRAGLTKLLVEYLITDYATVIATSTAQQIGK